MKTIIKICVVLSIILIMILICFEGNVDSEQLRLKNIKKQFSSIDGSHRDLTKKILKNLKDPKSFEHITTKCFDNNDFIVVEETYRAKNSFGAYVTNTVTCKYDIEGNLIEVIE